MVINQLYYFQGTYYIAPKTYPNQSISKGRLVYKYRNLKTSLFSLARKEVSQAGESGSSGSSSCPQAADNPYQWILDYVEGKYNLISVKFKNCSFRS